MEDVTQVSPSLQGACTPGGNNIWTATPETSAETEPPQEKRAKREAGEEEPEEGEIMDSSDEEKEKEEEGNPEVITPSGENCDGVKGPANEMEVIKDEPANQCINEEITGSTGDSSAARESAEVSMTKEDAAKEPEPVHARHCHDENESANAADSCGLE